MVIASIELRMKNRGEMSNWKSQMKIAPSVPSTNASSPRIGHRR